MQLRLAGFGQFYGKFLLSAFLAVSSMDVFLCQAGAQDAPVKEIEGYVTAAHMPEGFDVNREHVTTRTATTYGVWGHKGDGGAHASADAVQVGAYVHVAGVSDKHAKTLEAKSVQFRDDWDKKLSGFGVIDTVISTGAEPVYQADGYRIRITPATDLTFVGELNRLADVKTNTWVRYKGKRGADGVLVASEAKFVRAGRGKPGKTGLQQDAVPSQGSLLDADGKIVSLHAKVRLSQAGGWCGWHKLTADEALQQRIVRIGRSVIPAYQRQLDDKDPSKISFRFYVVEEDKLRFDLDCNDGLILIPKRVVERLQNDDQLAALLADGVAYHIQIQSAALIAENRELMGAELAGDALFLVPGASLATEVGGAVVSREIEVKMEEERGRMALALMADAGYDPRQAPEAWRLLAPKELPNDLSKLKYPSRSGYQLGILNLQYSEEKAAVSLTGSF